MMAAKWQAGWLWWMMMACCQQVAGQSDTLAKTLLGTNGTTARRVFVYQDSLPDDLRKRLEKKRSSGVSADSRDSRIAVLDMLASQGYIRALVDVRQAQGISDSVFILAGDRYWLNSVSVQDAPTIDRNAFKSLTGKPWNLAQFQNRLTDILETYQEAGYPFAQFVTEDVSYAQHSRENRIDVAIRLKAIAGARYVFDSIRVVGVIREKPRFVARLTRITPSMTFRQSLVDQIPAILSNTPYYENVLPPRVLFTRDARAIVVIELKRKKANRFDAVLGLLPARSPNEKLQFTGQVDVQLVSALRWGETIQFQFEQLPNSSQNLNFKARFPFLAGLPVSPEFRFTLFKQDSTFLNRTLEPRIGYRVTSAISVAAFSRTLYSSLLTALPYRTLKWPPPPALDGQSTVGGLQLVYDQIDYRPNPTRGLYISTEVAVGRKTVSRNPRLDSLEYNRIVFGQARTEALIEAQFYQKVWNRQVLAIRVQGWLLEQQQAFLNDIRWTGGARSLRGFNENQFPALRYAIGTLEYRLLLDKDAYLGAFLEAGVLDVEPVSRRRWLYPISMGITLSLRTPLGIAAISYAIGSVEDQPFQPTRGRVHIGLTGLF
jgi:outer membrane protein assembly factor BamA